MLIAHKTDKINSALTSQSMFSRTLSTYTQIRQCIKKSEHVTKRVDVKKIHSLGKSMLLANTISCGVLMGLGDLIQQEIEHRSGKLPQRYDYVRLVHMSIVGLTQGPLHHFFYRWLYTILPKRDLSSIIRKILLDQFLMSPVCITEFFYLMNYLDKKPLEDSNREFLDKFLEVYRTDWSVWPPVQFINFYVIPVKFQVIYINFMTMLYNVYLSYIKHREPREVT